MTTDPTNPNCNPLQIYQHYKQQLPPNQTTISHWEFNHWLTKYDLNLHNTPTPYDPNNPLDQQIIQDLISATIATHNVTQNADLLLQIWTELKLITKNPPPQGIAWDITYKIN